MLNDITWKYIFPYFGEENYLPMIFEEEKFDIIKSNLVFI